jgi:cytochrome c oxidase subunit II
MRRTISLVLSLLVPAVTVHAGDWGMGEANRQLPHPSIFRPLATPAHEISTLAVFVLGVTAALFVIVSALLAYSVIRFRARRPDDGSEPPQLYGSAPVEFAWTAVPVLIVLVLILVTARSVYIVQATRRPARSLAVRVVGHQWWWELRYPELGIVTANELHVPVSDPRDPLPTFLELTSADVVHSFWVPQLAGKTDVIPNKTNVMWMDPQEAGTYLGQCAEFCGTQREVAIGDTSVATGRDVFASTACVSCHVVRGVGANGRFGPDLTHLMSRETLAAGAELNTTANLKAWI